MEWITKGFEGFSKGTMENGGQNLYVSKKGILQRIFQYDLNHNGYVDLVFANCQNHGESAPAYVYAVGTEQQDVLLSQGSVCSMALDIDGDMEPELQFDRMPTSIERMQGDGTWKLVRFEKTASGGCRLFSPILTQRAAIFRIK